MSDLPQQPEFQLLFEAMPHPYLVLRPDAAFTIVAANDRYLAATGTQRHAIVGHGLFEIFPDNPDDRSVSGVSDLRASLNRVMADRRQDVMGVQKYDIPRRDGSGEFEVRYWSPVNTPVFGPAGDIRFITHHVEDVTEFILSRECARRESAEKISKIEARAERSEAEVLHRATELKEANRALKTAMEALENRGAELAHLYGQLLEQDRLKDASLANALHRLDAHLGNSPLAIVEFDPGFRVTRWSETAEHLFGWRADEIVGRAIAEIPWVHEDDLDVVARISAQMLSGISSRNRVANRNYRNDGSVVHCEWYNSAIYDGRGNLVSILSQVLDVTEIKRVEKQLLENGSYLRQLIATLPGMVWICSPNGAVEFMSQQWLDYTGTTLESQLGDGAFESFHPEDQARVRKLWQEAVVSRGFFQVTYRLRRHDGVYHWVSSRGTPILNQDGTVIRWVGIVTDIDDLKRSQEALEDSEKRYKALFNNKTMAIAHLRIVADDQGSPVNYYVEALNDTYERIIGVKNEAIIGKLVTEAFPGIEDLHFDFIGELGRIGLGGGEGTYEIYFTPNEQWLSLYAYSPKHGEVIAMFTDATAQKKAELGLAHERELLSAIVENIPVMLCLFDPKLQRFRLNRHMEKVLGWTTEDANEGDFIAKVFPNPENRAQVAEYMAKLIPGWREFDSTAKDGTVIPGEWANVALSDETVVGIGIDLRESKLAQARLALHAERQGLLLEVASGILAAWDDKAEMAEILFEKVKGHLKADACFNYRVVPNSARMELVSGLGVPENIKDELKYLVVGQAFCGTAAATGTSLTADRQRIASDELGAFVRRLGLRAYMVHPLLGLDGRVIGTLSLGSRHRDRFDPEEVDFLRTIAFFLSLAWERRLAEQQIQQLNADLERRVEERTTQLTAANRELEGFTFAISHDLKGPLGRINSFSTLLEKNYRDRLEGDGLIFLDFIRQNAGRLVTLVDDLLSHARVARDDMELQPVDIPALVQAVLRDKSDEVQEAGAKVTVLGLDPAKPIGDPHTLNQALSNLVENAIKYSNKAASPMIKIGGEKAGGRYRLWVRDNGIGFDMSYHDKIFEMFRRLHTYREYKGSGVGLALVKRAMERMGGKVWAESAPGQGATFFLELPTAN